ncbi:hypothetical protein F5884DRAFT_834103 [Xylogone sp. PMI_703]|nr:hypothetical protein F5884DRAFT_834103 [Xylogone sp. PMI_703]
MAPDLNSVPPSPRPPPTTASPHQSMNTSRRPSQHIPPTPLTPLSPTLNILPSNQNTVNQVSAPTVLANIPPVAPIPIAGSMGDNTGVGSGPGPLRHPRPLTAADLHLQLEKEQEAVVNRLTRELSMLRAAQNASVVSNASSTSAGLPDTADHSSNHLLSGPSHPAPSQRRHHRSSSSTSVRSITGGVAAGMSAGSWGISGMPPSSAPIPDRTRGPFPRHDSDISNPGFRRSGASSPAPLSSAQSSYQHPEYFPSFYGSHRASLSSHREPSTQTSLPTLNSANASTSDLHASITSVPTTGRYEETAYHRNELEAVKRENEILKRRIRELERTLRARRQSDASRTRSESVSTTASVSRRDSLITGGGSAAVAGAGRGRDRDREDEDVVRVGESARSGGLR